MTEIQGKSILVRASARFELVRVRVIGSQLYLQNYYIRTCDKNLKMYHHKSTKSRKILKAENDKIN